MCGDSGGGSGSGGGDGGGDGGGGSDGVGGGATVVAALREGGGDSGRDHGEVGVHGEGAWKAEAGQTCHGGGARTNTKAFKAWVDESAVFDMMKQHVRFVPTRHARVLRPCCADPELPICARYLE